MEFEFREEQDTILFSKEVQNGFRTQPASTSMGTEISVGKFAERDVDHARSSVVNGKNGWS